MPTVYQVFLGPENRAVTVKLLQYSVLMFALPLGVFYAMLHGVFRGDVDKVGWCGIAAVVAANVVIAAYVVMAWNEPDPGGADKRVGTSASRGGYRID